jgi:hypothetical protein
VCWRPATADGRDEPAEPDSTIQKRIGKEHGGKSHDVQRRRVLGYAVGKMKLQVRCQIKEIKSLEWGTNNSPENLNQGFTHMFFLTFKSEADRAIYLPHPAHKAFGGVLGPHLDKVLVLDYWAN